MSTAVSIEPQVRAGNIAIACERRRAVSVPKPVSACNGSAGASHNWFDCATVGVSK
jgi:hypothetical protein